LARRAGRAVRGRGGARRRPLRPVAWIAGLPKIRPHAAPSCRGAAGGAGAASAQAAASTFPTLTGGRGPGVRPGVSACAAPRREESLALLPGLASGLFSWMRHDAVAPCLDTSGTVDYTWQRMLTRLAGRARRASGGRGGPEGAH